MNREEITKIINEEGVEFIKLMFVDLNGALKTFEVSTNEIDNVFEGKIWIDGSNIAGCTSVNTADTILKPDLNSFRRLPFYDSEHGNVAMFMCDIYSADGKPSSGCARSNLKRELSKMNDLGFSKMNIGFEPEFFLFKKKPVGVVTVEDFVDTGRHYANESNDRCVNIRREIMFELKRMGIKCSTSHHEHAPSQYEITYRYLDALDACDTILMVRALIKAVAEKHNLYATFMPKPVSKMAGNGLHANISLMRDGENAFADTKGYISNIGKAFITGVLTHARGLCLLTNPTINSYKRIGLDGYEAPVNICWGEANRSSMVRVPLSKGEASRIEVRNVDSTANPYLATAGMLAAGLDGIRRELPLIKPMNSDIYKLSNDERAKLSLRCLPANLDEAIAEFENDDIIKDCLPAEMCKSLVELKRKEVREYNRMVNSFDFDNYF
jgi:glutamine synthetase